MIKKDDIYIKAHDFQSDLYKKNELTHEERVEIFFLLEKIKEVIKK